MALFLNIRYHNGGTKEPLIDAVGIVVGYYALTQTSVNLTRSVANPALAFAQIFFQYALRKSLLFGTDSIELMQLLVYFFGPIFGGIVAGGLARVSKNILLSSASEPSP